MWRVHTASRLHLGLLSLPSPEEESAPGVRRFGGVGLMLERPGVCVRLRPSADWSAEGPLAARALEYARRVARALAAGDALPPRHLHVEEAPPEHAGLGVGTQLGLAVAALLARSWGIHAETPLLARWSGRGLRSALGVHGFARGGFLVEGGKRTEADLSPLVVHRAFPPAWRVVVLIPSAAVGLSGPQEQAAFAGLTMPRAASAELSRLVLLGMLPALAEADLPAFGEAVHEFNRRVGEVFAPVQGGTYSSPAVAEVVAYLRRQGITGAGQSSWGPGVFAFVADEDQAAALVRRARADLGPSRLEVYSSPARNRGACVSEDSGEQ